MLDKEVFNNLNSREIDSFLGVDVLSIERTLFKGLKKKDPNGHLHSFGKSENDGNQTWIGLEPDVFQTPYSELLEMLQDLSPKDGSTLIDLGAGYGRIAFLLEVYFPKVLFQGIEYVKERVDEANRVFEKFAIESRLVKDDLTCEDFKMPLANYYFIYDYSHPEHIRQTLNQISAIADKQKVVVIGRGKGVRSIIEYNHPWLAHVNDPIKRQNYTIYYS